MKLLSLLSLLSLLTFLLTTATPVTSIPIEVGPKLLLDALLYGTPHCIRRCFEVSLPIGGCDGDKDQVIGCLCDPQAQDKMLIPIADCVNKKKSCSLEDIYKAQARADYSSSYYRPDGMAYSDANKPTVLPSRKEDVMTRDQMILVLHKRAGLSAVKKLLSRKTDQEAAAAMSEFVNTFVGLAIVDAAEPTTKPTSTTTTIATTTITAAAAAAVAAPQAAKPVNQYGIPVARLRRRRVDDESSALKSGDGHSTGIRAFHRPDSPLMVTFQRYQSPLKLPCPKKAKDSVNPQANISFVLNTEAKVYHQTFVTVECEGVVGEGGIYRAPKRKCKTHFPWLWGF
ncbi:hypothetical protein TWF706_003093 [Orbilia oligospora]|nr:hypothetical protein TWF706_003093 [Orbilia oligospora]